MKNLLYILTIILFISCNENVKNPSENTKQSDSLNPTYGTIGNSSFLKKYPLLTLMRKTPVEIGCLLESEFKYRDSVFNCDYKNYKNNGDPCKKITEYYEGIRIPGNLIKQIHQSFKELNLDFEHGKLREIKITFEDSMLIQKINEQFNFPIEKSKFPVNIQDIDYGENIFSNEKPIDTNYTKWLIITGFDHVGAGEAGCK